MSPEERKELREIADRLTDAMAHHDNDMYSRRPAAVISIREAITDLWDFAGGYDGAKEVAS
jgi:hypothetical protein